MSFCIESIAADVLCAKAKRQQHGFVCKATATNVSCSESKAAATITPRRN